MVQLFGHQFGSGSSSKWVEFDKKEFGKMVDKAPSFQQLTKTIGPFHSNGSKEALWNKMSSNGKGMYSKENERSYKEGLETLLKHELKCVLNANYFIGSLLQEAKIGVFSRRNDLAIMPDSDYGASQNDSNIDKAAKYLIHTSNSLRGKTDAPDAPITTTAIKNAIANAALYDVRSEATLRDMHRRVVFQQALRPTRGMALEAPYPSTGGAGYLLEQTFKLARGLPRPPDKDPAWKDIACFLLGAVIRSHGFTDGNGRIGRAAFAAAMVKGGLPFKPLAVAAEKRLHGLDQVH